MKKALAALVVVFTLVGIGCQGESTDNNLGTVSKASGTPDSKPSTEVPVGLQNDAYHYYGLNRKATSNFTLTIDKQAEQSGSETVTFKGMDGNKAKFSIDRSGALEQMGSEQIILDDKGITVDSTSPGILEGHPLDMPASLTTGATWKTDYKVKLPGQGLGGKDGFSEDHSTFKVVGPQQIKTKAGTFDAILVESEGNDTLNDQKFSLKTQSWYVKDRGAVKIVVSTFAAGRSTTLTIEAAPGDSK